MPTPIKHVLTEGQRFGKGVVIAPEIRKRNRGGAMHRWARLRCDCGVEYEARIASLACGHVQSCGCYRREWGPERSSRCSKNPLYQTWHNIIDRCENENSIGYPVYGARGVTVCARWHDSRLFIADIEASIGPRPPGLTLDRITGTGNYEPGNVRWATLSIQGFNRSAGGLTADEREVRRRRVYELWSQGKDADEITEILGTPRWAAVNDVKWIQRTEYRHMVYRLWADGETAQQISDRLGVSFRTVEDDISWVVARAEDLQVREARRADPS